MNNTRFSKRGRLIVVSLPPKHKPAFTYHPTRHITDYIMSQSRIGVYRQSPWVCSAQVHAMQIGD